MNYVTSHDDGWPFDKKREKTFESGTKLLLAPGISQVYYGDESARSLEIEGTQGDATLRSFMNWDDIQKFPNKRICFCKNLQQKQHYRQSTHWSRFAIGK
jgi:alpha-amylase